MTATIYPLYHYRCCYDLRGYRRLYRLSQGLVKVRQSLKRTRFQEAVVVQT